MDLSRRELLGTALVGAGVTTLITPALATGFGFSEVRTDVLPVPASLPDKVFTTERVGISRRTHETHLGLFAGYARRTNQIREALKNLDQTTADPNQIVSAMRGWKVNYAFAYGGYLNHLNYFATIGGDGSRPTGDLLKLIEASFGSYENWERDFVATAMSARGWVFVAVDEISGRVYNLIGDAQDTFPMWGHRLLLATDVYEHAFFLDFASNRRAYVDAYLKVIDWKAVGEMLK